MVLAVNRPAQLPQPGQAAFSTQVSSSLLILPASKRPAASNAVEILMSFPFKRPGSMGPPLHTTEGMFRRSAAISMPGTILSQLGISTMPSKAWPLTTASMLSAISSRLTRGYFMPTWPMAMPSHTPMAGTSIGTPPAASTPYFTIFAWSSRCACPGIISLWALTTAIKGLRKSSSEKPKA